MSTSASSPILTQGLFLLRIAERRAPLGLATFLGLSFAFALAFALRLGLLAFAFTFRLTLCAERRVKGWSNPLMNGLLHLFFSSPNDVLFHEILKPIV